MPWVGLLCVIVVFPDHTHLLFESKKVGKTTWRKSAAQTTSKYTHRVKTYIERKIGTVHGIRILIMFKLMNKAIITILIVKRVCLSVPLYNYS